MLEALAAASGMLLDRLRRAAMMAGDIARVARALLEYGEASLEIWSIQPLPARSADAGADRGGCRNRARRTGRSRARI